jgi:transposase
MQIVYPRCCGLDVHKKSVVACVLITADDGAVRREIRTYATMTADLLLLRDWLESLEIQAVAMESTGVFWHPLYTILEDDAWTIILVNAHHIKAVPGRKTDVKASRMVG